LQCWKNSAGARLLRAAAAAVTAFANVFFALSAPARADNQIGDHWAPLGVRARRRSRRRSH
jgi:hypothetical protein